MSNRRILLVDLGVFFVSTFLATAAMAQSRVGPSFECGASVVNQPLAQIVCADGELARLDLSYVIAYVALRESLDTQGRVALRNEASAFVLSVTEQCNIPKSGELGRAATPLEVACIKEKYDAQRGLLVARVSAEWLEEAKLTPEEALAIQRALQRKGFLSAGATIDGVIGPATRSAIVLWQKSAGRRETGVATRSIVVSELTAPPPPTPNRPVELHRGATRVDPLQRPAADAQSQPKLCRLIGDVHSAFPRNELRSKGASENNPLRQRDLERQAYKKWEDSVRALQEFHETENLDKFVGFIGVLGSMDLQSRDGKDVVSIRIKDVCPRETISISGESANVEFSAVFTDVEDIQKRSVAAPLAPLLSILTTLRIGRGIIFDGSMESFRTPRGGREIEYRFFKVKIYKLRGI